MNGRAVSNEMLGILRPDFGPDAPATVHAAFTLRTGGVSKGCYASLNLGTHVGDAADHVAENRRRLRAALSLPGEPLWLSQVHGKTVLDADALVRDGVPNPPSGTRSDAPPVADAVVTRQCAVVCAIMIADCMPVLFAARDGSVVGAAHAGWRGLVAGVLENTVRALDNEPSQLLAWLGPCIGPAHFEVGAEVRAAFLTACQSSRCVERTESAFKPNDRGRWQCDLRALARARLEAAGVTAIHGPPACTFQDASRFFSHRRDGVSGRLAALIWRT